MNKVLDKIDKEILEILEADARASIKEISEKVGLSPSPCKRRITILEKEGYISGYTIKRGILAQNYPILILMNIILSKNRRALEYKFEDKLLKINNILSLFSISGKHDFAAIVGGHSKEEIENIRSKISSLENVSRTEMILILEQIK